MELHVRLDLITVGLGFRAGHYRSIDLAEKHWHGKDLYAWLI